MGKDVHQENTGLKQSVILHDTVIDGEVKVDGDILLAGKVNGDVFCSGTVVIRKKASVSGGVSSRIVDLEGEIGGDVKAEELVLRDNALIRGEVVVEKLRIYGEKIALSSLQLRQKLK